MDGRDRPRPDPDGAIFHHGGRLPVGADQADIRGRGQLYRRDLSDEHLAQGARGLQGQACRHYRRRLIRHPGGAADRRRGRACLYLSAHAELRGAVAEQTADTGRSRRDQIRLQGIPREGLCRADGISVPAPRPVGLRSAARRAPRPVRRILGHRRPAIPRRVQRYPVQRGRKPGLHRLLAQARSRRSSTIRRWSSC